MSSGSVNHAIAGSAAGCAAMALTYPLASWTTARQSRSPQVESVVKSAYAGLESALLGISTVNFLYYYVYNALRGLLLRRGGRYVYLTVSQSLFTSVVAGVVSRILTNPIWVANTKMTLSRGKDGRDGASTISTIVSIYREGGVRELMSGLAPALVLVASPVIQFTMYEQIKNVIIRRRGGGKSLSANDALLWGGVTKLAAILVTYPYYTLRTRMHMDRENLSLTAMTKKMYYEEGVKGFYGGLDAKLVQSVVNACLVFYLKEHAMNVLKRIKSPVSVSRN